MDPEIEIRHLLPSHRRFLSDVLDADDHWKSLAAVLMKPDCSGEHLISSASMILLEREKSNQNGSPTRALLDYWGTFGRKHERPRIKDLLNALKNARLFRAADYVSVNLLNGPSISAVDEDEEDGITDNLSHFEREKVGQTVSHNFSAPTAPDLSSLRLIDNDMTYKILSILEKAPKVKRYDLTFLQTITRGFQDLFIDKGGFKIGEGGFGSVFQVRDSDGTLLAVKVLKADYTEQFVDELQVVTRLSHPNLLSLKGIAFGGSTLCLVYEYMANGSLADQLIGNSGKGPISWQKRVQIALKAAQGIEHLHKHTYTHRDLKSANILLDANFSPKVGDFGLARLIDSGQTTMLTTIPAGTSPYMPYEAFFGQISPKVDIFSFGIILLELLTGRLATDPFVDSQGDESTILSWIEEVVDKVTEETVLSVLDKRVGDWDLKAATKLMEIARKATDEKQNRPTIGEIVSALEKIQSK